MPGRHVVVDGSNIATEGRNLPSLAQLDQAVREYLVENPDDTVTVVVDASFAHRIDASEIAIFEEAEAANEVVSPPAGAIGRGDAFLLRIADKTGATVLSNDSFQEFHGEYEWLFNNGRLIGGKPVPGVGWIFTPRTPVRGPKSREAVKEAKRKRRVEPEASTGLDMAAARGRESGPRRGKKVAAAIATATEEAVDTDGSKRRRRRKVGEPPAEPVNEPLAFITFIAAHPLGSEVIGSVESFSSHGAFVVAEGTRCYLPLSAMGDPPPRSAREVLSKSEDRAFVVQALDPLRRGVELAMPGFAKVAGRPTEETIEAEIVGAGIAGGAPPRARLGVSELVDGDGATAGSAAPGVGGRPARRGRGRTAAATAAGADGADDGSAAPAAQPAPAAPAAAAGPARSGRRAAKGAPSNAAPDVDEVQGAAPPKAPGRATRATAATTKATAATTKATAATTKATAATTKATRTPSGATNAPAGAAAAKAPTKAAKAPTKAAKAPTKAAKAPTKTAKAPTKTAKAPTKTAKVSASPATSAAKTPVKASKGATKTPAKATKTPARATKSPSEATKAPGKTSKAPAKATRAQPTKAPVTKAPVTKAPAESSARAQPTKAAKAAAKAPKAAAEATRRPTKESPLSAQPPRSEPPGHEPPPGEPSSGGALPTLAGRRSPRRSTAGGGEGRGRSGRPA